MIACITVRWAATVGTLMVLASSAALAQELDRSKPPELGPPPELRLPEIQQTTLVNGLEISVVEMHEVPVVNLRLILDAGSERDPAVRRREPGRDGAPAGARTLPDAAWSVVLDACGR